MIAIPESHADLFDKKSFAYVATIDEDSTPQVTPVWIDTDGEYLLINSAAGRKKDRNLRARRQIGLCIQDPDNTFRHIGVQGSVVEITEEGAVAHIHKQSRKYEERDYPLPEGQVRVIYKIRPDRVWTLG